ncbi:porin [Chromobacterium alkanivorans]|uniref:porin n=1 Tax=Chromobacterium alkanivorans TaxID=1071719 RepID=UPI001967CDC0|nr:porin [Chromobacterium alkanivorans]MBN3005061.1 porin [Chromobacterium alkanivorans]
MLLRHTWPPLLAACLSPFAWADSFLMTRLQGLPLFNGALKNGGVAPYGTLDLGVNYSQAGGKSTWQMQSGGEWTSKFGLAGRELLGGGWKAEFNLEAGFNANDGTPQVAGAPFNREAWLGLESPQWGALRLGRQLNAGLPLFVDPFGAVNTNSVYSWVGMGAVQTSRGVLPNADLGPGSAQLDSRAGGTVKWMSPRGQGFNVELLQAAEPGRRTPGSRGAMLAHLDGPLFLAASLNQSWQPLPQALGTGAVRNDFYGLAAVYDTGRLVLSTSHTVTIPRRQQNGIARVYTAGAIVAEKRHVYRLSIVYRDTSSARDSDGRSVSSAALGLMLGYDYMLSKRTGLYARAGSIRNLGGSTLVLNSQPLPTDALGRPLSGIAPVSAAIGLYHNYF